MPSQNADRLNLPPVVHRIGNALAKSKNTDPTQDQKLIEFCACPVEIWAALASIVHLV
jgi:hypothetical protein